MSDIVKVLRGKYALDYDEKTLDQFCNEAADEIERLRAMLQTARHNALKEARLVIADKSVPETPATFEDIMERDIEMMNAIRALGEKE